MTKIVLVDTNCFIRLFHSSARPIFGLDIGGYKLLTLNCLIKEYLESPDLIERFPWIAKEPRVSELKNAKLKLRAANKQGVQRNIKELKPYTKAFLETKCKKEKIETKSLSKEDLELLATCVTIKCLLATDEWPLRLVAADLMEDPEEYEIGILNSLELIHLFELNGLIDAKQRRITVDAWVRQKEKLLRGWQHEYQRLFSESAEVLGL